MKASQITFFIAMGMTLASLGLETHQVAGTDAELFSAVNDAVENVPEPETFERKRGGKVFSWVFDQVAPIIADANKIKPLILNEQSEVDEEIDSPIESSNAPDVRQYTFPVRVRGYDSKREAVYSYGTSVSIGGGQFATCKHLTEGMVSYQVDIEITDDDWRTGQTRFVGDYDLAVVTIGDVDMPAAESRDPEYMEPVVVFGLKSNVEHEGIVSETDDGSQSGQASLVIESTGVTQGDSGCGVFGMDGSLIGIVRGHSPPDSRVVRYTPINRLNEGFQGASTESQGNSSALEYMLSSGSKMVVLTAPSWCGPCQQYEPALSQFEGSVEVIDIDRYPEKYQLLKGRKNSVPQTLYVDGDKIKHEYGPQSVTWLQEKLGVQGVAKRTTAAPTQSQKLYYYQQPVKQRLFRRRR